MPFMKGDVLIGQKEHFLFVEDSSASPVCQIKFRSWVV